MTPFSNNECLLNVLNYSAAIEMYSKEWLICSVFFFFFQSNFSNSCVPPTPPTRNSSMRSSNTSNFLYYLVNNNFVLLRAFLVNVEWFSINHLRVLKFLFVSFFLCFLNEILKSKILSNPFVWTGSFESRYIFRNVDEFPPPQPYQNIVKLYNSKFQGK